MEIKKLVIIITCALIAQSTTAATLEITNFSKQTMVATILWNDGYKGTFLFPNEKKSLCTGLNPITASRWHTTEGTRDETGDSNTYQVAHGNTTRVSLSHKIKIASNGYYQYDNQALQKANSSNSSENDWTT